MRVLVTAGPTREYLDDVRFLTNGSSGRMGYAVAAAAVAAGHDVALLTGPVALQAPAGCEVCGFVSVDDLARALDAHFPDCDALIMTAAVGDFRPERRVAGKIPRASGPVTVRLVPTEDLLAGLAGRKRAGQTIVAFAVEAPPRQQAEAKARAEMAAKGADLVVVNTPAAMGEADSDACILSREGVWLPRARRTKRRLAEELVQRISEPPTDDDAHAASEGSRHAR